MNAPCHWTDEVRGRCRLWKRSRRSVWMSLLVVAGPIVLKNPIDDPHECIQLRTPPWHAPAISRRHRERQHLAHRLAVQPEHPRGLAGAHPLETTRPPGPARTSPPDTSPRLPVRATLTEGYTRSHFGPPQPDQPAASVGDYCAAVLRGFRRSLFFHFNLDHILSQNGLRQLLGSSVKAHVLLGLAFDGR